ncbi:MAG: hypothetical protein GY834_04890, partial [Bacteroidetes bacterium]|nr:hypothetical protein [Bacteroidota bacterium]
FTTVFPRIWSSRETSHINKYKEYIKGESIMVNGKAIVKPTFRDNLRYFFSYQLGHMYVRYFLWNFVGRQNDIESQGTPKEGNWISGIDFIDNSRLGDQDLLPDAYKNHATNKFYFLPLILGFIGIFFHLKRSNKDSWVVFLLFLMTGLAIIIFVNQHSHQPRERDYAYAGSFYAFAIWIGLGVISLVEMTTRLLKNRKLNAIIISGVCLLLVPVLMATEGWDDHDRSGKYAAVDFAKNYLNHCDENGILYTFGDNDTFPLWYAQEVEGIRTDVRVVNYMLSAGYWYVHQLARKAYDAEPLPFTLNFDQYNKSSNDLVPYLDLKVEGHQELIEVIRFIASENEGTKRTFGQKKFNILPTKKLKIKVDSAACVDNGIVPRELAHLIVDEIEWEIKSNGLYKNGLAFLDFLANNKWERPIYFSSPHTTVKDVFNVDEYIHLDGVIYKFMPVKASSIDAGLGSILVESAFDKLVNKSKWGNLNDPKVTVDRESMRNVEIAQNKFIRLTHALMKQNKFDMAVQLADKFYEVFPPEKFPISKFSISLIEAYYKHGSFEKANKYNRLLFNRYAQEFDFCLNYPNGIVVFEREIRDAMGIMQLVARYARVNGQKEFSTEMEEIYKQKLNSI